MSTPLTPEEIQRLLAKPKSTPTRRKKKIGIDNADRTTQGWFKRLHFWSQCEVPTHDASRNKPHPTDPGEKPLGRMCIQVGSHVVCRYCYLGRQDISAWGENHWGDE